MRLFGALEIFAASANPLLGLQKRMRKLGADLLSQEFQHGDAEQQVELDFLFIFGASQGGLQQLQRLAFPGAGFRAFRAFGASGPSVPWERSS